MSRRLRAALDECLGQLWAGASVKECLARFPDYARELRPLLHLASDIRTHEIPPPRPAAVRTHRQRMLRAVHERGRQRAGNRGLLTGHLVSPTVRAGVILAAVIALLGSGAGGLAVAASGSLPGDLLYPMKRATENAQRFLATDRVARQELEEEFARRRYDEVRAVLDAGRTVTVEFEGSLEEIGDDFWVVGGLRVNLDAQTTIENRPAVGRMVSVRASLPGNGSILARYLRASSEPASSELANPATPSPTGTSTSRPAIPSVTSLPEPTRPPEPAETSELEPTEEIEETELEETELTPEAESADTEEREPTRPPETEEPELTDYPQSTGTVAPEPTDDPEPIETDEPDSTPEPEPTEDDD